MPTLHHLYQHIKQYGNKHQSLYVLSLMLFFFAIYDGIISFVTPLVITEAKISETLMGIIIGFSSVAGAFFDFLLCKTLKNTHYRRLFFFMFAITLIYPLIIWQAKSIFLFLIAMALWGLYYDFYHLGCFDFVGRKTTKTEHVSSFGVIQVFYSLGYLIAPLLAGLLIGELANFKPFLMAWPAINGAFADYIAETPPLKKEVETLEDYFTNLGYVIGPIMAGFLGEHVGHTKTFTIFRSLRSIPGFNFIALHAQRD